MSWWLLDAPTQVSYGGCHDSSRGASGPAGPRSVSGPERPASDAQQSDGEQTRRLFELRNAPTDDLAGQADAVAAACHAMAVRFHRGGRLVVFGTGGASTDAQHVAV